MADRHGQQFERELSEYIGTLPAVSDHEHHQTDAFFSEPMGLDRVFRNSYVAWTGHGPGQSDASRAAFLDHVCCNSYYRWLEKGIQAVHGIDDPISVENWDAVSGTIAANYQGDADFHWRVLRERGYERMILDTYWNPGDDNGHPQIFVPTFRIDKFMYGFHETAIAPNDFPVWEKYGFAGGGLDDFVELMESTIRARHDAGKVAALKCAEAYFRTIDFLPDDKSAAERVFGSAPATVSERDRIVFGNYVFNRCCELAKALDIPFQVHCGLGDLRGSNPLNLQGVIAKYPEVRFVLFHSGYPWTHQAAALSHNFNNAFASLTWTPLISTTAASSALNEFLDTSCSVNTITWGSDCWTPEESIGALLAWRHVVKRVIAGRVDSGLLDTRNAFALAEKLLNGNNRRVYNL